MKIKEIFFLSIVAVMLSVPLSAYAQISYPAKKIVWLIPYKPGGGFDIFARAITPYLEKYLRVRGGGIIIKNEPAASGEKAISLLYHSAADGYTIGSFAGGYLADHFLQKKEYDITKLTYILRLDEMTRLIVTRKSGPKSWQEVVAASRVSPIKWGIGAFGRDIHIATIIANEVLALPAKFIAYGGTAENINALVRGDVQISTISEDSAKNLIDSGEMRVLLTFDKKSRYPGAVSIQDLGHPELINPTKGTRFLAGPPKLNSKIVDILVDAFLKATKDKEFIDWAKRSGFEPNLLYGKDLESMLKELLNFYREKAPVIKARLD